MENSSFENVTMGDSGVNSTGFSLVYVYLLICILGLIGNGLVIFVTCCRMKMSVSSLWFLNLAVADFILVFTLMVKILWILEMWPEHFVNDFLEIMAILNMFASVFFLTVISLDRCLCTWLMVWTQNRRTLVKARIVCVIVWLLSICCSAPFYTDALTHENHLIYEFTVTFLIPFVIIACSYTSVGVQLRRLKRVNFRPFWVVLSLILLFFICWFPFHVFLLCHVSALKTEWSDSNLQLMFEMAPFIYGLRYLNSCLNPFLYVFMCEEYKKKLKQSVLLVLETAFAEDHLTFRRSRQMNTSSTSNPSRDTENTASAL